MQETEPTPVLVRLKFVPGLVKLNSISSLKLYLRDLMNFYERETDRYGDKVGRLIRHLDSQADGNEVKKLREVEWKKTGMVMLSTSEPERGTLELLIEAMEDYKAKATRTAEVLTNIDKLDEVGVPADAAILVYMRHGVPLRILIDSKRTPEVDSLIAPLN